MGNAEFTEWWLDESSLPDVIWARLRVRVDGSAEIFDCDGRIIMFSSATEAENSLLEDEYVRLRFVDPDLLSSVGLSERELAPPIDSDGGLLRSNMCQRDDAAEAIRDLAAVAWLRPWRRVTPAQREAFGRELRRELHPDHPLNGRLPGHSYIGWIATTFSSSCRIRHSLRWFISPTQLRHRISRRGPMLNCMSTFGSSWIGRTWMRLNTRLVDKTLQLTSLGILEEA